MKQLTVVGAGWAGLATAVAATQAGWHVRLFEATPIAGGRARRLTQTFADQPLDNGQHILIGAYTRTLGLMKTVGLNPDALLQRVPLDVRFANGSGLHLPAWVMPLNLLAGVARAQGWSWRDKFALLQTAWQWQRANFDCDPSWTVNDLCLHTQVSAMVTQQLIEPLCLSALNTPMAEASAVVFLRVLRDALWVGKGSSDLLLPRTDLNALLPDACLQWLGEQGADIELGKRLNASDVIALQHQAAANPEQPVVLACPAWEAARLTKEIAPRWSATCTELTYKSIATVYLHCTDSGFTGLQRPMVALHSDTQAPAQFLFDRGALNSQPGLLAAVVSACNTEREALTEQVRTQVCQQLGLTQVHVVQTVVEKRATLASTPWVERPKSAVVKGLWASGDFIDGPYPSTLEGAVQSGQQVVAQIGQVTDRQRLR